MSSSRSSGSAQTWHRPLYDLADYDAQTFMATLEAMLAANTGVLAVPSWELIRLIPEDHIKAYVKQAYRADKPVAAPPSGNAGPDPFAFFSKARANWTYGYAIGSAPGWISQFELSRPVMSISDRDRAILVDYADLVGRKYVTADDWARALAMLVWNDGRCLVEPHAAVAQERDPLRLRTVMTDLLRTSLEPYDTFIATLAASTLAIRQRTAMPAAPSAGPHKARWMSAQDLRQSPFYKLGRSPTALVIGYEPATGHPVTYAGNESLITIGGAGSGKSQTQVIPNLLAYPGSAIVLDVKGELWDQTAGWRRKTFGPVYRFAPTDAAGRTHRYNPFDFIATTPDAAANDCSIFSTQVILDNPKLTDPYWESRGRDMMWAWAMLIALKTRGPLRTMLSLAELLSLPLDDNPQSPYIAYTNALIDLGHATGITDLVSAGHSLISGLNADRLDSVLDTARRYMSPFARSGTIKRAISASDWHPLAFRTRPGTTLYICLSADELKTYGPLVRLMLAQHAQILKLHQAKPGELPITFFLDEMPQLGNFDTILNVQDLGRSAGLRLWMFAQTLGQLARAFGRDRYKGVVEQCRVRCFMQPDSEATDVILPTLGEITDFNGNRRPLATRDELMGRAFHDRVIVTTRNDTPMALAQKFAWKEKAMTARMVPAPPVP